MKKNDISRKLAVKRTQFIERSAAAFNLDLKSTEKLLGISCQQSLRINTLANVSAQNIPSALTKLGWEGEPYNWIQNCYTADKGLIEIRDSSLINKGYVYIQNAASWIPVHAMNVNSGEHILDMCAAPGGKSSHIAAEANNNTDLWVNDNSYPRITKLKANLTRLSVKPAQLTMFDARYLSRKLPKEYFNKILLDSPCSGEGMLDLAKDSDMIRWSVAHIRRLHSLQKQLILQAWQLLKPGGLLVYSTCTIAPEENELVIDYLLRKQPNAILQPIKLKVPGMLKPVQNWNNYELNASIKNCLRLAPSKYYEAFFVAVILKDNKIE